jgi:hypothetical protein
VTSYNAGPYPDPYASCVRDGESVRNRHVLGKGYAQEKKAAGERSGPKLVFGHLVGNRTMSLSLPFSPATLRGTLLPGGFSFPPQKKPQLLLQLADRQVTVRGCLTPTP